MSAGRAKGTGYIMPSMQVGMWTPNLSGIASPSMRAGNRTPAASRLLPRGPELCADARDLPSDVGSARHDGHHGVEPRLGQAAEPRPAVGGSPGQRERLDHVIAD